MQFLQQSLLISGLAFATSAAAQASTGQACPSESVSVFESCSCPPGTEFQISTTYAILGVNAADFNKYTASFYDLSWQGITNLTHQGPDKTAGSLRTLGAQGLSFIEELVSFQSVSDGSYRARFALFNPPIEYPTGNGSYSGYWITFDAEYVAQYETALKWQNYACFTGHPIDYASAHASALKGLLATMGKAGLVKGNTTGPYAVQDW